MSCGIIPRRTDAGAATLSATADVSTTSSSGEMVTTVDHRSAIMAYSKLEVPAESTKRYSLFLDRAKLVAERVKGDAHLTKLGLMKLAELDNFIAEQQSCSRVLGSSGSYGAINQEHDVTVPFLPPVGGRSSHKTTGSSLSEDVNHSTLSGARVSKRSPGNCTVCLSFGESRNDHRANNSKCPHFGGRSGSTNANNNKRSLSLSQPIVNNAKRTKVIDEGFVK